MTVQQTTKHSLRDVIYTSENNVAITDLTQSHSRLSHNALIYIDTNFDQFLFPCVLQVSVCVQNLVNVYDPFSKLAMCMRSS